MKSARRFAELCEPFFADAIGSRSVVLLVLESRLLKFRLLVLVVCFEVEGRTRFEKCWLFIGFIVFLLSWVTFSLWRLMRKHVRQNKKSIAHKTVLCASSSGYCFSAENRLRISGCSENRVFHFLLWPLMRNERRIRVFFVRAYVVIVVSCSVGSSALATIHFGYLGLT